MTYRLVRVERVSPHVSAEISGVDLVRPITADAFTEIRSAFGQYGVVFFRDQDLTPEQHVTFAERFAPIDINRFFTAVPGYPMIAFDGWTEEESRPLLEYLYQHAVRPEFACRFHWRSGSLALWDNRSTWHFAVNDYHGERRLLHRITIQGSPLH